MYLQESLEEMEDKFGSTWIIYHKLLNYKHYNFSNELEAKKFQTLLKHFCKESKIEKESLSEVFEMYRYRLILS